VYGTVRTVVWEVGGGDPASYPIVGSNRKALPGKDLFQGGNMSQAVIINVGDLSLQAEVFGLPARCPTLKTACYHSASKDSLSGGRQTFRGGILTR
jgi:hypothetical protein